MKFLYSVLVIIYAVQVFPQITGSTQTGRLITRKTIPEKQIFSKPEIILTEPVLKNSSEIKSDETSITIRGKIVDEYGLKEVTINNTNVTLHDGNNFYISIPLHGGKNNIKIIAENTKGAASELSFSVSASMDEHGPSITILEPSVSRGIKVIRKTEVTSIKGIASDVSGVSEVRVNNKKASLSDDGEFNIDLYLQLGDNRIIVEALDSRYNSSADTFTITRKLDEIITAGRYIGLIIGINSYEGHWRPLKNAVNDARAVADVLKNEYNFNQVYTILDEDATRRNIIQKFEELTSTITADDNLLIFYAGHGQFNKALNKGYWVPVDAKTNSVADYISNNDVKTFLGGIRSKHTLLITDACFAGDIFRGSTTESIPFDPNNMAKYYREVYRKPSRIALTSGGVEEVMDAGKEDHSIFTYYLVKALKDNESKYLDASQLFNEFRMAVTNNSDQTPMLQVVRDTNDEGGMFVFVRKD